MPENAPTGIYKAIVAIMREVGAIGKDATNESQKWKYRSAEAMYNRTQPLFAKHGIFTVPRVIRHERHEGQSRSGTTMFYSIVEVEYTFYHEDGSSICATVVGEAMDTGDKSSSKAMTTAHRKAVFQVLHVPFEIDDPDSHTPEWAARLNGRITLQELSALKKAWWDRNKDSVASDDPETRQNAFVAFVDSCIDHEFNALDWKQWTKDDYDLCLEKLS